MLLFAAAIAIPPGLDLHLPAPDDKPLTAGKIALGRRLNQFLTQRLQPLELDVLQ